MRRREGINEVVSFMGDYGANNISTPSTILRRDTKLADQQRELGIRLVALNEHRQLVIEIRRKLQIEGEVKSSDTTVPPRCALSSSPPPLHQPMLLKCYMCPESTALSCYSKHVEKCRRTTASLYRKMYFNPIRFAQNVPAMRVPTSTEDAIVWDEYNAQASECLLQSMVSCYRCKERVSIHALASHNDECTGLGIDAIQKQFQRVQSR